jgi:hypothetical protein
LDVSLCDTVWKRSREKEWKYTLAMEQGPSVVMGFQTNAVASGLSVVCDDARRLC